MTTFLCPLCSRGLEPYGAGEHFTCAKGHHFKREDIEHDRGASFHVGETRFVMPAWVPGAVLGGLALLVAIGDLLL